jgi:hypothetical protein
MNYPEKYSRFDSLLSKRKKYIEQTKKVDFHEMYMRISAVTDNWINVEVDKNNQTIENDNIDFVSFLLRSGDFLIHYRFEPLNSNPKSFNWHKSEPGKIKIDFYSGNFLFQFSTSQKKACFDNSFFNKKIKILEDLGHATVKSITTKMPLLMETYKIYN